MSGFHPLGLIVAIGGGAAALLLAGYYPPFARATEFRSAWVSAVACALGAGFTLLGWRHRCRGTWGSLGALLDNGFYVAAFAWAAANTRPAFGLLFSAILAVMLMVFQGSIMGFSVLIAAAVLLPTLAIVLWVEPAPLVSLSLISACIFGLSRMAVQVFEQGRRSDRSPSRLRPKPAAWLGERYELGPMLAAGGMGVVFQATTDTGREVAVKLLHLHLCESLHEQKRLLQEALIVNDLDHEGVVEVIDHGISIDERPYLVMELLDGQTLRQRVRERGGQLSWEEVVHVAERVLHVLEAAHAKQVVHCDVKPNNIFLCAEGRIKLLDFGIARPALRLLDSTLSTHIAGTPTCMAPEQVLTPKRIDGRADLWAVGATMFWSLTGTWPREIPESCESLAEVVTLPVRTVEQLNPDLPADLALAINVALRFEPDARWSSARAFRNRLLHVQGVSVTEPLEPVPALVGFQEETRLSLA